MLSTPNLALPYIDVSQSQREVTHNEALRGLDALVQIAVLDRDLASPPASPSDGQRWIVAASPTGAWSGHATHIAAWQDGAWHFYSPQVGWLAYVIDEGALIAWSGTAWTDALSMLSSLQNMTLLGVGTTADSSNPFSAKLNNALWVAKTVAEGGDGNLRYKMSKEGAANTLSYLFQDHFSGRAEIGLTGDDDFHFKVSSDGTSWIDAIVIDNSTGAVKVEAGFRLIGDISPAQITASQNDYNPTGLDSASVLRLSTDASRDLTGLAGGADGRLIVILNVGSNNIVLKDASSSSSAANRFSFGGADITVSAGQGAALWYDATDSRWRLLAGAGGGGGGGSSGAVRYDSSQSLSAAQQAQARANVYAAPFDALAYNGMQVNGSMEVSQENGTSSVTLTATTSLQSNHLVDGVLAAYRGSFVASAQQVTDAPNGYRNSLKFTVGTAESSLGANDELSAVIPIEGTRTARLAFGTSGASALSFAFWVKAHRTGTYSGSVRNAGKSRSYPFTFSVSSADTWEYKTVTIATGDTTGTWATNTTVGLYLTVCIAGGSSRVGTAGSWAGSDYSGATGTTNGVAATTDAFQLTGVVLLPGIELPSSDRAPFIMRPYDRVFSDSQRYFEQFGGGGMGKATGVRTCEMVFKFVEPKRTTPSISLISGLSTQITPLGAGTRTIDSLTSSSPTVEGTYVNAHPTADCTVGDIVQTFTSPWLNADARLT